MPDLTLGAIAYARCHWKGRSLLPDLMNLLAAEIKKYDVKPEVEAFNFSHIFQAVKIQVEGKLTAPLYVQFVMGVKNAMPADREVFDFDVKTLNRLAPGAPWCGAEIGANQIRLNEWSIAAGGLTRARLEDNGRLDRDTLAPSNAALIRRSAELCEKFERPVPTPAQAREILGLQVA